MGKEALNANLSAEEVTDITAFLRSLTGVMPKIDYPELPYTRY